MKVLKKDIQILLSSIREITKTLPTAKQSKASASIQKIVQMNKNNTDQELLQVKKALDFKYNFFKLAYPNIKPTEIPNPEPAENLNVYWSSIIQNAEESQNIEQKNEENDQESGSSIKDNGTYVLEKGKLVKGEATKKKIADHMNWFAGNVDPDDLRRHKELLDRQHFRGPFWDGKEKPKSVLEEDPSTFVKGEGESNPYYSGGGNEGEKSFQKVKR